MASCGSPTRERQRRTESAWHPGEAGYRKTHRWMAGAVLAMAILGLLAGCAPTIRYGSPPRTDRLGSLKLGESSTADVLLAFGVPRGHGAIHHTARCSSLVVVPPGCSPDRIYGTEGTRKIWFYEYTVADGDRIDLNILLVFFDQDKYDGHLWFSSAQLLKEAE